MVSKEEVLFLIGYLFLVMAMFIISEVIIGVEFPRDFIIRIHETLNISKLFE